MIHEWWGLNDYPKKRAAMLAEPGFVASAADMYGDGHVTDKPDQAREWMQEVTADVEGWRERVVRCMPSPAWAASLRFLRVL